MAFISAFIEPKDLIGKVRTLKSDVSALKGTITKGSKVVVTGVSNRGFDVKDVESGEDIIECGFDCINYLE